MPKATRTTPKRKGGSGTPRKSISAKPVKKISTRAASSDNAETEKKITAFLKKKPDQKRTEIAKATGLDGTTVKAALVRMGRRSPAEIATKGVTVNTTYSLST